MRANCITQLKHKSSFFRSNHILIDNFPNKEESEIEFDSQTQKAKVKKRERDRLYRIKNKDAIKERDKRYRLINQKAIKDRRSSNVEAIKESDKRYRSSNKDTIKERDRLYRINNKENIREYYGNNKESLRENYIKKNIERNENYVPTPRRKSAQKSWNNQKLVRDFFDSAAKLLYLNDLSDWYRISRAQVKALGVLGSRIFTRFGLLGNALQYAYPEYEWDLAKFSFRGKKAAQRWLFVKLKQLLPDASIIEDYYHPDLTWDKLNNHIQLDVWVPEFNLALEYQGEHHYHDLHSAFGPSSTSDMCFTRDVEKKQLCKEKGIALVSIPYWWDGQEDSLSSTLHQTLPHLFPMTDSLPIPSQPIDSGFNSLKKSSHHASLLMHGLNYQGEDPTDWIMSEKLDGIRAYWDGVNFYSKKGKIINAPLSFKSELPTDIHLDGELWSGYDNYEQVNSIIKLSCGEENVVHEKLPQIWKQIKFCVFDAPKNVGSYKERHLFLENFLGTFTHVSLIPIHFCKGMDHLLSFLQEITEKNGEGIMLYHSEANYQSGRTRNLLKVKDHLESDVKFRECAPNSYCFICEQENGKSCRVKCNGADYMNPPSKGTVLTVRHHGFYQKSGKLKYPSLFRIRSDLNWNDIINKE